MTTDPVSDHPALDPALGELSRPAQRPTLYFIGVTTGRSSIRTVFPRWAHALGLGGRAPGRGGQVDDASDASVRGATAQAVENSSPC